MRSVFFSALGRRTSQIGLGCGTLTGRATLREARALVEAALDLGIRYFDTAPLYGMGTSEEVLGDVVGNMPDVIIATKVGLPRPAYSSRNNIIRKFVKPLLDQSRLAKTLARRLYASRSGGVGDRAGSVFHTDFVMRSVDESLRLLRRARLDVLLAHDPTPTQITEVLATQFEHLRDGGLCEAFGAAVTCSSDASRPFGTVWQSAWPGEPGGGYCQPLTYCFHGVIRNARKTATGALIESPSTLVRKACDARTDAVFLVSASSPAWLRQILCDL